MNKKDYIRKLILSMYKDVKNVEISEKEKDCFDVVVDIEPKPQYVVNISLLEDVINDN